MKFEFNICINSGSVINFSSKINFFILYIESTKVANPYAVIEEKLYIAPPAV